MLVRDAEVAQAICENIRRTSGAAVLVRQITGSWTATSCTAHHVEQRPDLSKDRRLQQQGRPSQT